MKLLYKIPLDESAQPTEREVDQSDLAQLAALQGDESLVDQLSSNPSDVTLSGRIQYGDPYAKIIASELEEIATSAIDTLPVFRVSDRNWEGRGYYEIQSVDVEPVHPNSDEVYQYDISLSFDDTRANRWRAIESNPRGPGEDGGVDHEFGNEVEAVVGIPETATKAQWYDKDSGDRKVAEPVDTVESEFGAIDLYDLEDAPWYEIDSEIEAEPPLLLYDVPYADEYGTDCRIYDTRGEAQKYVEFDDDHRARVWQSVFSTGHEPEGAIVLDNGVLRVWLDEGQVDLEVADGETYTVESGQLERYTSADIQGTLDVQGELQLTGEPGSLRAQRWNGFSDDWDEVSLPPTRWGIYDVNVREVGMVRDEVQVTFVDGTELFALNLILVAGHDGILIDLPDGEDGPIPTGIESQLEPIASESVVDPGPRKTLRSKQTLSK